VVTLARWALAYLHRQHLGWSYERIGDLLGKDHSAMLYGYTQACVLLHEQIQPFSDAVALMEKEHGYL
jgi:chromosomal replication initiation ATPase DnaA